ncbi:MAG: metallophosphoesterase [Pseudomonadota bacterium]
MIFCNNKLVLVVIFILIPLLLPNCKRKIENNSQAINQIQIIDVCPLKKPSLPHVEPEKEEKEEEEKKIHPKPQEKEENKPILKNITKKSSLTTLSKTISPIIPILKEKSKASYCIDFENLSDIEKKDIGKYTINQKEEFLFLNDDQNIKLPSEKAISLSFFSQITDIHLIDEEAPSRSVLQDIPAISGFYRYAEQYSTQFFDSAIRTLNKLSKESGKNPDHVFFTGDIIENALENEKNWFFDIIKGNKINPDSGDDEDPIPCDDSKASCVINDPNDPFKAEGLLKNTDWHLALGNHDLLLYGNFTYESLDKESKNPQSKLPFKLPFDPLAHKANAYIYPSEDYISFEEIKQSVEDKIAEDNTEEAIFDIIPDDARALITLDELMKDLENHFQGKKEIKPYYSFVQKSKIPIKFLILNTYSDCGGSEGIIYQEQFNFIEDELASAQANKELVILVSHHGKTEIRPSFLDMVDSIKECKDKIEIIYSGDDLESLLAEHENVILHISGHTHENRVFKRKNYYEITTSSLIDFPMQMRLLEIVFDPDQDYGFVYSAMLDADPSLFPNEQLITRAREIAFIDYQLGNEKHCTNKGEQKDRNVIIPFKIPKDILLSLEK